MLVTGGYTGGGGGHNRLSSTETFTLDTNQWSPAGALPSPREGLSGATIGNTVFVFGRIYKVTLHLTRELFLQEDVMMTVIITSTKKFSTTTRRMRLGDLQGR